MNRQPVVHPDAEYRQFLADGRFMIQRSTETGAHIFYPRLVEPGTGAPLEWVEASGRGIVYSVTVAHRKPPEPNYAIALIDLEEGVRMMASIVQIDPEAIEIGMSVVVRIEDAAACRIVFVPEA